MADRSHTSTPTHDPKSCALCGTLRHPANSAKGRALAAHLRENPLPRQAGTR